LELLVPSLVVGRTASGRCWLTTIGVDHDARAVLASLEPEGSRDPDGFTLSSPLPHAEWMSLVESAVRAIEAGRFDKVVVAREVLATANRAIHVPTVLRRLRSLYPACTVVGAPVAGGQFVAASPEVLVARAGSSVVSHPLAGTIPRSGDPHADQALADGLLASPKDRAEHDWVVRDVVDGLGPSCSSLDVPETPSIVSLRNVSHLGTLVTGTLVADAPSALGLAAVLHPTAAVGGTPRDAALAWLAAHERLERGPYAAPVGWVDARGDGEWVVGIRSAVIDGPRARMFAGVGVVDGSDPAAELAETQFKLQALLAAVVRP
jgi:menaquinone-specific isochorismate synthase